MKLTRTVVTGILEHARKDAPIEACGYLAEKEGVIVELFRLRNTDASPEHFNLDPAEQFATVRQIRSRGLRLSAVYHSHPASPARPSAEDIRLANDPFLKYVILSLQGTEPVIKSFEIRDGQILSDPIETIEV